MSSPLPSVSRVEYMPAAQLIQTRKSFARSQSKNRCPAKVTPQTESKYNDLPSNDKELEERRVELEVLLKERFDSIALEKVKPVRDLGEAIWLPDRRIAKVIKKRGKHHYAGFTESGQFYLYAEEVLFLLEIGDYLVYRENGLPLSLEEAYELLVDNEAELDQYRVFATLLRSGYHIKRARDLPFAASPTLAPVAAVQNQKLPDDQDMSDEPAAKKARTGPNSKPKVKVDHRIVPLTMDMVRHRETVAAPIAEYASTASNWTEYKEIGFQVGQQFTGLALDMTDLNVQNMELVAPSRNLFQGGICRPVINPCQPYAVDDLFSQLKAKGPKEGHRHSSKHSISGPQSSAKISFELFYLHKGQPDYTKPDAYVAVFSTKMPLTLEDAVQLNGKIEGSSTFLVFAVVDCGNICFFKFTPFACWDEMPQLWAQLV